MVSERDIRYTKTIDERDLHIIESIAMERVGFNVIHEENEQTRCLDDMEFAFSQGNELKGRIGLCATFRATANSRQ